MTPLLDAIAARANAAGCEVELFVAETDGGRWLRVSAPHGGTLSYFGSGSVWANLSEAPEGLVAHAEELAALHRKLTEVQP